MAVNSRLISQNQIDTTYGANLDTQKQVAAPTSLPNHCAGKDDRGRVPVN